MLVIRIRPGAKYHSQAKMTEEYLKGDERVYQEGFADLDLAMIPKLKNHQLSAFYCKFIVNPKRFVARILCKLLIL